MYASHLNQCRCSGSCRRRDLVLLRVVEAAAVDAPVLAGDALLRLLGRREAEVEPDEVERRADPGDPGDDVQHPQARGRRGLSGSPRPPVPRDLAERPQPRLELLAARALEPLAQHRQQLGPRAAVRRRRRTRSRSAARTPRSAARARRAPRARRRAAPPTARRSADASRARRPGRPRAATSATSSATVERILARGELVDEPRAPREQRRQLLDAQLPR